MNLCLSILFVLVSMTAAGPISKSTYLTALSQFLGEQVSSPIDINNT